MLTIEPVGLHWLPGMSAQDDLCAHGGLVIRIGATVLVDDSSEEWALSAGALFLLRTLMQDHGPASRVAEHLVPHCGHAMYARDDSDDVFIGTGCCSGRDWSVERRADDVMLDFGAGGAIRVPVPEWRNAVVAFAGSVIAFHEESAPKTPPDPDVEGFAAYRAELARRWAAARDAG